VATSRFTPDPEGHDVIELLVSDGRLSQAAQASATAHRLNRAPMAQHDVYNVDEGLALCVGGGAAGVGDLPTVPGCRVGVHVHFDAPVQLAFDPEGDLFVGYDVVGNTWPNDPGLVFPATPGVQRRGAAGAGRRARLTSPHHDAMMRHANDHRSARRPAPRGEFHCRAHKAQHESDGG
jgi:hypothetical protein